MQTTQGATEEGLSLATWCSHWEVISAQSGRTTRLIPSLLHQLSWSLLGIFLGFSWIFLGYPQEQLHLLESFPQLFFCLNFPEWRSVHACKCKAKLGALKTFLGLLQVIAHILQRSSFPDNTTAQVLYWGASTTQSMKHSSNTIPLRTSFS